MKSLELPMKFNPGTLKYEPQLPSRESEKTSQKLNIKISWIYLITMLLVIIASIILIIQYLK